MIELAASGTVPSETTMRAWKRKHDAEIQNPTIVSSKPLPTTTTTLQSSTEFITPEIGNSVVLQELEKVKHAAES